MKKTLIALIVIAVFGILTWKMLHLAQVECAGCIRFGSKRECTNALGPDEAGAKEEAHRTLCARLTSGVTEVVACQRVELEDLVCKSLQ